MDDKDTFLTVSYKGGYIHSCHNRTEGREEIKAQIHGKTIPCRTRIGAKRAITKALG